MKVVIEKIDAHIITFDQNKNYIVLKNFDFRQILGFAKITLENGVMYADLRLNESINGFPAIGFSRNNETGICRLDAVGICDNCNLDQSINAVEYVKQLEGKPSNLKTK